MKVDKPPKKSASTNDPASLDRLSAALDEGPNGTGPAPDVKVLTGRCEVTGQGIDIVACHRVIRSPGRACPVGLRSPVMDPEPGRPEFDLRTRLV